MPDTGWLRGIGCAVARTNAARYDRYGFVSGNAQTAPRGLLSGALPFSCISTRGLGRLLRKYDFGPFPRKLHTYRLRWVSPVSSRRRRPSPTFARLLRMSFARSASRPDSLWCLDGSRFTVRSTPAAGSRRGQVRNCHVVRRAGHRWPDGYWLDAVFAGTRSSRARRPRMKIRSGDEREDHQPVPGLAALARRDRQAAAGGGPARSHPQAAGPHRLDSVPSDKAYLILERDHARSSRRRGHRTRGRGRVRGRDGPGRPRTAISGSRPSPRLWRSPGPRRTSSSCVQEFADFDELVSTTAKARVLENEQRKPAG